MNDSEQIALIQSQLSLHYGSTPEETLLVRAPYRICPLGAHIDHQLGVVTALAIDRAVHLAFAPLPRPELKLRSTAFPGEVQIDLSRPMPPARPGDWGNYARGAAAALQGRAPIRNGLVGITAGALAEGGLSSSAAAGVAYLLALQRANGLAMTPWENVELDRQIENTYLGVRNGILDQAAILLSRAGHLTTIDCKAHTHALTALSAEAPRHLWVLAFSGLRQSLVTTGYNSRVEECRQAAAILLDAAGRRDVEPVLGNVAAEEHGRFAELLPSVLARRARHFFSESARVEDGVRAWQRGDLATFGRLMSESGRSSILNYECGSPPLIDLFEILTAARGVYGARFSGAGFRGCCVALVDADRAGDVAQEVRERYACSRPELAADAPVLLCQSADGAEIL